MTIDRQSPKSIVNLILSDNVTLYPLYFITASFLLAGVFKYYEINDKTGIFENNTWSSFLFIFGVTCIPIFIALSIYRVKKIITFCERGIKISGKVVEIKRGSGRYKKLASLKIGYLFNETSYLIERRIRLVRNLKNLQRHDDLQLIVDPDNPKKFLVLNQYC